MRILMVSEDIPYAEMGGLAKHVLNLARGLNRQGHEVDILGGDQNPIQVAGSEGYFGGEFFGELSGHLGGWKEASLGIYMPVKRTWIAKKMAVVIQKHAGRYDIVHYHGHFPNIANFLPNDISFIQTRHDQGAECLRHIRFKNGDVCTSRQDSDCASCGWASSGLIKRKISENTVKKYRSQVSNGFERFPVIFVSDCIKRNFERVCGDKSNGKVIHNFVDVGQLQLAAENPVRLVPRDVFEVVVVGKLHEMKGIEKFLSELCEFSPSDLHVTVIGDGPDFNRINSKYSGDRVFMAGWKSYGETISLTVGADAVVVPSIWEEPCATTILEGLSLNKTTLALNRGGTPELARYASRPNQLRIFDDMPSLVRGLAALKAEEPIISSPGVSSAAGVDEAIRQLMPVYREEIARRQQGRERQ